ncbi:helix-turn-helix transcriptional regulator [Brevibacterium linens]|uniref:helix-turn-helix transcriptional regulator n=1 Tax=Brevibacterium linens TaxID=1703 RepID=UPI0019D0BC64|nr:helix-turn-helix transcriptional regulator [Brevibacterium linens]
MPPQQIKRAENVNRPSNSDGSPSVFDAQFGPRAASANDFASALEPYGTLSDSDLERIFRASGGRVRIAASLVQARVEAGLPAGDTAPDRTVAMLSPSLNPTLADSSRESAALYLLALFAWTPTITSSMVDLVHAAYAAGKVANDSTPDDLTPLLTSAGLLAVAPGDEVFTVPTFIRILMRRITAVDDGIAKRTPREALGMAVADVIGRQRADRREGLPELLDLVLEIRDWKILERGWARRSVNVFIDVPTSIEALLSVPEAVIAKNPILTLARSAARRIDSTRHVLGTDDPWQLMSATDFDSIVVPELHGRLTDPSLPLSGDEVAVLTMLEARRHRLNRKYDAALDVIDVGRKRMLSLGDGEPGPTLMLQAELNLERGRNLVAAGRFTEATPVLQSVVHFAGIYTPNSPHPLLAGLVESALAGLGHGHGSEMDRCLERARENARRFGMDTLPDERTALSIELMRSLDRLDLNAAEDILGALDQAKPTQSLGPMPDCAKALYYVYRGWASIAAKLVTESSTVQIRPTGADGASARFSGIVNVVGFVLAAAGETKTLQDMSDRMSSANPGDSIVKARQALVFGQHDRLWTATGQALSSDQGPRLKSCAMALRADILHHEGQADQALETFVHMLDYCAIAASVFAVAQLSKAAREALIPASADFAEWEAVARSFHSADITADVLQQRLLELPETSPVAPDFQTDLTPAEQSLLFAIDSSKSIAQIAREFGVVSGTLKNRLSALYRKLGVRSRAEAVAHVHRQQ